MVKDERETIEIKELKSYFKIDRKNVLKAVDGITFDIYKGETFGLSGNPAVVNLQLDGPLCDSMRLVAGK